MPTIPAATNADGMTRYWWVPAIADTSAVSAAAVTAGVDLSCWITDDGWQPGADQAAVTDKRICATQDFEGAGRHTRTLMVKYVVNPAGTNTAHTTLVPGTLGFIVERRGVSVDTAAAASQKVNVWPVQVGIYQPLPPEANSKLKDQQKLFITGPVIIDSVLAA